MFGSRSTRYSTVIIVYYSLFVIIIIIITTGRIPLPLRFSHLAHPFGRMRRGGGGGGNYPKVFNYRTDLRRGFFVDPGFFFHCWKRVAIDRDRELETRRDWAGLGGFWMLSFFCCCCCCCCCLLYLHLHQEWVSGEVLFLLLFPKVRYLLLYRI